MASSSSPSPRARTWQASDFSYSLLHHFPLSIMKSCQLSSFNVSSITPSSQFSQWPPHVHFLVASYISWWLNYAIAFQFDSLTPTSLCFKVTRLIWFIVSHAKTSTAFDFLLRKFKITAWHANPSLSPELLILALILITPLLGHSALAIYVCSHICKSSKWVSSQVSRDQKVISA